MAKKASNADMFMMDANADPAKYLETMRVMAKDNLTKTRENYEKAKAALEEVQKDVESGVSTAQSHGSKLSLAAIEALKDNTEATFDYWNQMVSAKTVSEAFELHTAFLRKQAESAVDTAKSMQAMAQSAAEDLSKPMKEAAEKAMKNLKA